MRCILVQARAPRKLSTRHSLQATRLAQAHQRSRPASPQSSARSSEAIASSSSQKGPLHIAARADFSPMGRYARETLQLTLNRPTLRNLIPPTLRQDTLKTLFIRVHLTVVRSDPIASSGSRI